MFVEFAKGGVKMELKPCPFCGSEVELKRYPLRRFSGCYMFNIRCEKCGCRIHLGETHTLYISEKEAKNNAITAWNRRAEVKDG